MPEVFSNNTRMALGADISDSEYYVYSLEPVAGYSPFAELGPGMQQRATIYDPADPSIFEIVKVTEVGSNGYIGIERGQEGTQARAWPAGTLIDARITAGMLGRFNQRHDPTSYGVTAPNPRKPATERGSVDVGVGRVSVVASSLVTLGTAHDWPGPDDSAYPGEIYKHPDAPGFLFQFGSYIQRAPHSLPSNWNSNYFDVHWEDPDDPGHSESARVFVSRGPGWVLVEDEGVHGFITEVGFYCTMAEEGHAPPTVDFWLPGDDEATTKTLAGLQAGAAYRLPLPPAAEGIAEPAQSIEVEITTPSDMQVYGYFYCVMIPIAVS